MRHIALTGVSALASAILVVTPAFAGSDDDKMLDFDTMAGVTAPYTGGVNAIRGVPGGGLPWMLDRAQGSLRADGRLDIRVRGLVLADDPAVPPERRGINPVAAFRAVVSCMSIDGTGAPSVVNRGTDSFPATTAGDAYIVATVDLPAPCIAPVVFVTSPAGAWFAATGL